MIKRHGAARSQVNGMTSGSLVEQHQPHVSETPATQFLRAHRVPFLEHVYDYREHGGAMHSASELGVHCALAE